MRMYIAWLVLVTVLGLSACADPETPEAQIRAQIAVMAEAGEDGDIGVLGDGISRDYEDLEGNDRRAVLLLMRGFLMRTDRIAIFADTEAVSVLTDDYAEATVRVRFAGANLSRFDLRTSVYRFVLGMERDGSNWQVVSARWSEAD